jgi:hypothetical protein
MLEMRKELVVLSECIKRPVLKYDKLENNSMHTL